MKPGAKTDCCVFALHSLHYTANAAWCSRCQLHSGRNTQMLSLLGSMSINLSKYFVKHSLKRRERNILDQVKIDC